MIRKDIFDALRDFAPNKKIPAPDVDVIDALLDRWGIPRDVASTTRTSQRGIDLIHEFEQFRENAYPDPATKGPPITIGWGSTRDEQGKPIKMGDKWSRARADAKFAMDLAEFEKGVAKAVDGFPTTQGQWDALVSFAYNLGIGNLSSSTLLKKHRAGDFAVAANEFARWNRAAGKVMNGLTRRRAAEAALYRS